MLGRCRNPRNPAYKNYGGRGITVCERWLSFSAFYDDMGDCPEGLSLDRIDNNAGYSPENCRWADRSTQMRNRRNVRILEVNGESAPLSEWAERYGVPPGVLRQRIYAGWPSVAAVTTPVVRGRAGKPRGYLWRAPQAQSDRSANAGGLSREQVAAIRATPKTYGSGRALAQQYGVSETVISRLRSVSWCDQNGVTLEHFDEMGEAA